MAGEPAKGRSIGLSSTAPCPTAWRVEYASNAAAPCCRSASASHSRREGSDIASRNRLSLVAGSEMRTVENDCASLDESNATVFRLLESWLLESALTK